MRFIMNQIAKAFVRVAGINQEDMRSLFIILADKMVGEERFAGA
ncbi:hypothetical protein IMSAGC006_01893 [Muribaculaceae bacterium]|nr:hypothetical protein IMSAGC006_01893 [Muribaculaceae bacterium]